MNNLRLGSLACLGALFFVVAGCGGGGGSSPTDGGGSGNPTLSYHLTGFRGSMVNAVTASQTPQTVQVNVGGTVKTISNVIVSTNMDKDATATVLSEGSQLLNASITNSSAGATIGVTAFKAPLSTAGVLQASILGDDVNLFAPAASWQGYSLPNGFYVGFSASADGIEETAINTSFKYPGGAGNFSGTGTITYTSPSPVDFSTGFGASDGSQITMGITGVAAASGSLTAPWQSVRASSSKSIFTNVQIRANF